MLLHFGDHAVLYKVFLNDGIKRELTAACIKLYKHADQAEKTKLMKREHDACRLLLAFNPRLAETSSCYVSMLLDVPFTA